MVIIVRKIMSDKNSELMKTSAKVVQMSSRMRQIRPNDQFSNEYVLAKNLDEVIKILHELAKDIDEVRNQK